MKPVLWAQVALKDIERAIGKAYDTRHCLTCDQIIQDHEMDWRDYWVNGPYHKACSRHPMVLGAGMSRNEANNAFMENGTVYVTLKKGAEMLGGDLSELKSLVESGELPVVTIKRSFYVAMDDVNPQSKDFKAGLFTQMSRDIFMG